MAGRIPQSFIDELVSRVDIVDVVGHYVPLKPAGQDFQGLCPFHNEKSPSFTVSRRKQFYHCFGCGAHGTVIGFLMEYARLSFPEAVQQLADQVGLALPADGNAPAAPEHGPLLQILEAAARYFEHRLRQTDARHAVAYLKQRGLDGATAKAFRLGYAPGTGDDLSRTLGGSPAQRALLLEAGLLGEREARVYERFRDRVMFPILDRRGRIIGFGGRILGEGNPKYLNSPETPVFHKGRELYGLYQARMAVKKLDRLLVVEGYLDVLAMAQYGIPYAVATLGTAVTREHLEHLLRAGTEILFAFDGDSAGRRAAWKALEVALPLLRDDRRLGFLFLPEGEDPDSLIRREGPEAFRARLDRAMPLSEFLLQHLLRSADPGSLDGRAQFIAAARPLLEQMQAGALRQLLVQRLAELVHMELPALTTLLSGRTAEAMPPPAAGRKATVRGPSLVRRLVTLLLHHPALAAQVGPLPDLREVELPGADLLGDLLDLLREHPDISMAGILERFRHTPFGPHLERLTGEHVEVPSGDPARELLDGLERLATRLTEQRYQSLRRRMIQGGEGSLSDEEKREFARLSVTAGRTRPAASRPGADPRVHRTSD